MFKRVGRALGAIASGVKNYGGRAIARGARKARVAIKRGTRVARKRSLAGDLMAMESGVRGIGAKAAGYARKAGKYIGERASAAKMNYAAQKAFNPKGVRRTKIGAGVAGVAGAGAINAVTRRKKK